MNELMEKKPQLQATVENKWNLNMYFWKAVGYFLLFVGGGEASLNW